MRLLNTRTLAFEWFDDPLQVDYAILSHVWSKTQGEQSYLDVLDILENASATSSRGSDTEMPLQISEKIRRCCACALADGYQYVWIDSCCIDKSSSAELSEAINSMYKWYESASQCYAYLHDVDDVDNPWSRYSQFRESEWFKRGWTLQELIAPPMLIFMSKDWRTIGSRYQLAAAVQDITGIDLGILKGAESPDVVSVSRRMSWASKRKTTRVEDQAYCLMGLFDIHMPAVYGEGHRAFVRLQEEILKNHPDDTLFAWGDALLLREPADLHSLIHIDSPPDHHGRLFASSPMDFEAAGDLWPIAQEDLMHRLGLSLDEAHEFPPPSYVVTRYGVQAKLPLIPFPEPFHRLRLGLLLCEDVSNNLVALVLRPASVYAPNQHRSLRPEPRNSFVIGSRIPGENGVIDQENCRFVKLRDGFLRDRIRVWRLSISLGEAHLPRGGPLVRMNPRWRNTQTHPHPHPGGCSVVMPSWRTAALTAAGFRVQKLTMDRPATSASTWCRRRHVFIFTHRSAAMRIIVGYCEHCAATDPRIVSRPRVGSLRVQVQSCPSVQIPPTTPASLWFEEHPESGQGHDHVLHWQQAAGGAFVMTFSLSSSKTSVQEMRLTVTIPESSRDLVLTMDVEFHAYDLRSASVTSAGSSRTPSIAASKISSKFPVSRTSSDGSSYVTADEYDTDDAEYEMIAPPQDEKTEDVYVAPRRDKGKGRAVTCESVTDEEW